MPLPLPSLGPMDPSTGELSSVPTPSPQEGEKPSKTGVAAASTDEEAFPSPASLFSSLHEGEDDDKEKPLEEALPLPLPFDEEASPPPSSPPPSFSLPEEEEEAPVEEFYADEEGEGFTPVLAWQEVAPDETADETAVPSPEAPTKASESEEAPLSFPFFDDEEEEEEPEEDNDDEEEDNEEEEADASPATSTSSSKKKKKLGASLASRFTEGALLEQAKEKFATFKEQAAAELSGKSAPSKVSKKKDEEEEADYDEASTIPPLEDDDSSDEEQEEDAVDTPTPPSKKSKKVQAKVAGATKALEGNKAGRLLLVPLRFLATCYRTVVGFLFGLVEKVLTLLSRLPLVGKGFSWLLQFTRLLKVVALCLPLVLLLCLLLLFYSSSPPARSTLSLPDEGGASFSSFTYDRGRNEASGVVKNEGETRVAVTTSFTIYTSHWYDPRTWRAPQASLTCTGPVVRLEIDQEKRVTARCSQEPEGLGGHATGVLGE